MEQPTKQTMRPHSTGYNLVGLLGKSNKKLYKQNVCLLFYIIDYSRTDPF